VQLVNVESASIKTSVRRMFGAALLAASLLVVTPLALAADVTIFAASSLKDALDEQVKVFLSTNQNVQIRLSYAGSNALAKQIESGAPAQLFISADEAWMDYLAKKNLVIDSTRRDLVKNELVLIAPVSSPVKLDVAPGFAIAAALGNGRLSLANPDVVPAGKYAKAALTKLGVWGTVDQKIAGAENVRAALAFVARGETPLGIVYRTDAMAEPRVRVVAAFPGALHAPIVYPAAIVTGQDSPAARALLAALTNAKATAVWKKFGFDVAK
jgi:molybdate transport system substrate-binding protein